MEICLRVLDTRKTLILSLSLSVSGRHIETRRFDLMKSHMWSRSYAVLVTDLWIPSIIKHVIYNIKSSKLYYMRCFV